MTVGLGKTIQLTIAFKSSPFGFSLNEITLPVSSIFIRPKSDARLTYKRELFILTSTRTK
jgi:hypothetical protein